MGSNYKEEKKKIKERYDDQQIHNNDVDVDNVFADNEEELNQHADDDTNNTRKFLQFETENELDERSKNFRIQAYSSKEKCSTVKSVIQRFVIIFLITTLICGSVFLVSKYLAKKRLKTFIFDGNNPQAYSGYNGTDISTNILEVLKKEVDEAPLDELGILHLVNVQINPGELLDILRRCVLLKSLTLENVKINGEFNDTVNLPSLEDFIYHEAPDEKYTMTERRLKSIIFFRQEVQEGVEKEQKQSSPSNSDTDVDLAKIWTLHININITHEGYTLLLVDHTTGSLVLPWLTYLKRDEIIENAGKDLKRLSCNRLTLSIDSLPTKLTHLTLRDVKLIGGDYTDLFRKLSRLVDIRISASEPTTLDIGELGRKTLRNLALSKFSLFNSKASSSGGSSKKWKIKLDSLSLIHSTLSSHVLQDFPDLLQAKQVAIHDYNIIGSLDENENDDNEDENENKSVDLNELLLRKLTKTQTDKIFMYKYKGIINATTLTSIKSWLGGKLEYDLVDDSTNSFVLEKTQNDHWNFRSLSWEEWALFKHSILGLDSLWIYNKKY